MTTPHGPTPLPPTTILSTSPIPATAAHDFLTAYLNRATTDPALQPDATITEHGPTGRATASAPNLALHNLKRVQAGLTGEVLGRDLMIGEDGKLRSEEVNNAEKGREGEGEGWEDAKRYEQGEEDQEGAGQGEDVGEGQEQGDQVDKEERKRRKKERRLAEKRAKSAGGAAES